MYKSVFSDLCISDLHFVARGKSETHMIELINSSIRDNLVRFNRRSKRFSSVQYAKKYTIIFSKKTILNQ